MSPRQQPSLGMAAAIVLLAPSAWGEAPAITMLLHKGQTIGGHTYSTFNPPTMAEDGSCIFRCLLAGEGYSLVTLSDPFAPSLLAQGNTQAVDLPRGVLYSPNNDSMLGWMTARSGASAFSSGLIGAGVTSSNDRALWVASDDAVSLVLREGDAAPGMSSRVTLSLMTPTSGVPRPCINSEGMMALDALIEGLGVSDLNNRVLWRYADGVFIQIARTGDAAPLPGATFGLFYPPRIDDQGTVVFAAETVVGGKTEGVFSAAIGRFIQRIIGVDDPAPGFDLTVAGVGPFPLVAEGGMVYLTATLAGPGVSFANDASVWAAKDGQLSLVIREGDSAPGLDPSILIVNPQPLSVSPGGLAVIGSLLTGPVSITSENNAAIWLYDGDQMHLLVREGDPVPSHPGWFFHSMNFEGSPVVALNDFGQVAIMMTAGLHDEPGDVGIWGWDELEGLRGVLVPGQHFADGEGNPLVMKGATLPSVEGSLVLAESHNLSADGFVVARVSYGDGGEALVRTKAFETPNPGVLGDLNDDGFVNGADLGLLLAAWASSDPEADLNADGVVDGADLGLLLAAWS
jgi:hypothetical protein